MNRSALSQWAGWALACTGERAVGRRRVVRDARRECRRKGGASTIAPIVQRRRGVGWRCADAEVKNLHESASNDSNATDNHMKIVCNGITNVDHKACVALMKAGYQFSSNRSIS